MIVLLLLLATLSADGHAARDDVGRRPWRDRPVHERPDEAPRPTFWQRAGALLGHLGRALFGWLELPTKLERLCWGVIGLGSAYFVLRLVTRLRGS